jgi:hypothetical protein
VSTVALKVEEALTRLAATALDSPMQTLMLAGDPV